MKTIRKFRTPWGRVPFNEWLYGLDVPIRAFVRSYVDRVALGGAQGNIKRIKGGEGIFEIVIDRGPGYRVYFGKPDDSVMLLLLGGIKKTQGGDIELATKYWRACREKTPNV